MKKLICCVLVLLTFCAVCVPFLSVSAASYRLGDVDGDGSVSSMDITHAQRLIVHIEKDDEGTQSLRGDVDGSGKLNVFDVTYLMRYKARMNVPYPIGTMIEDPTQPPAPTETVKPTAKPSYELPIV